VKVGLVILSTLGISLSVGIWISSRVRDESLGLLYVLLVLAFLCGGLPLLDLLWWGDERSLGKNGLSLASPFASLLLAARGDATVDTIRLGVSFGVLTALSVLALALATRCTVRAWTEGRATSRWHRQRTALRVSWTANQLHERAEQLQRSPARWLAERFQGHQRWLLWLAVAIQLSSDLPYLVILLNSRMGGSMSFWLPLLSFSRLFGTLIAVVLIAGVACRAFVQARRSGAMELILTTPLAAETLVAGHWATLKAGLTPALVGFAGAHVLMGVGMQMAMTAEPVPFLFGGAMVQSLFQVLGFVTRTFALCWVGMWTAVTCVKYSHAVMRTLLLVLVLPWILSYVTQMAMVLGLGSFGTLTAFPWMYAVFSRGTPILIDLGLLFWAHRQLQKRFREVCSQPIGVAESFFAGLKLKALLRRFRGWQPRIGS